MSYEDLIAIPVWERFSQKMVEKIISPRNSGSFNEEEAIARGMRCIKGQAGFTADGNVLCVYWLVDPQDGVIVDAKYHAFGQAALIAAAESGCELVIGKNYDQAKRIGADLIDKRLRDKADIPAFPEETIVNLNLVLEAIDDAVDHCDGIPLASSYTSPLPPSEGTGGHPGWKELAYAQKIAVIEQVLNEEVRPYVELDEGGIEVQELVNDRELKIAYQGACTSCFSSIGATLSSIQQIIQTKVHPDLIVVPNMDALKL
jgi:NifU-like protein